ncbi:glycosyltransferase family 29 protein [Thermobifida halotolerans]|uniref:Glycosyltransferase family 29 protein n=1 Tax=Thermobifida halotolerans TaxID=483545 RepID=A0AA97M2A2_9ACTN|nr:glycosyltransferase family 29 protein [Thermobifida halotolerans]UOE18044.1 glycosyltransferase family 29 protein [Thermobifida halotolerans]
MFKHRTGWLRQIAGRPGAARQEGPGGQDASAALEALLGCVHRFVDHSRRVESGRDPALLRLREATSALVERVTAMLADPERARALYEERQPWTEVDPKLLDAVLRAGDQALRAGLPELGMCACDAVLVARSRSRAGWRLRARILEARGDVEGAVEAHQEYLNLVTSDDQGVGAHVAALRGRGELLRRCADLLREQAGDTDTDVPVEEEWAAGLDLRDRGRWSEARPRLARALLRLIDQGRPEADTRAALSDYVGVLAAAEPDRLAGSRALVEAVTDYLRATRTPPMPDPELGGTRVIGVSDFRNLIEGRSVCLVANSARLRQCPMGAEIDSYDLVVRFNSYVIDEPVTGARTDIHASIHKHAFNWGEPVTVRLVFGGLQHTWQQSIRKLVPGAQRYVGDRSLRWPVVDRALVADPEAPNIPTTGFNMLRLLDFLDVSPKIDLIGFDFYETGAYRLPAAMKLPITPVHAYRYEKEWVMAHARRTTDMRISLR